MSELATTSAIESPPPAPMPVKESADESSRARLHELARELIATRNRRAMIEFLRLRRALR